MFGFFNKRKDPVSEDLRDFQKSFTKEQKVAILGSLVILAKSKGQMLPKEIDLIEQTGRVLALDVDETLFAKIAGGGIDELMRILKTLNQSQKEWFVISMRSMTAASGKVNEEQIAFAFGLAEKIGFTEDEIIELIDKTQHLNDFFNF